MVHYKLTYFEPRGRAEPIRYLFLFSGVDYDYDEVTQTHFAELLKPTLPFGQLPILFVDGKPLSQTIAIAKYLAGQFKLTGTDDWDRAMCCSLVDGVQDVFEKFTEHNYYMVIKSGDTEKAAEIYKKIREENIAPMLDRYEKFLTDAGGDWFVANEVTWADLWIAEFFDHMIDSCRDKTLLDNHPKLKYHWQRVHCFPLIQAHRLKRNPSVF
uniref:Glutathione S-transferase n=1 Tax=Plectus sambesii TaxID=2011161 RepID=A0A914WZK5_9BILA